MEFVRVEFKAMGSPCELRLYAETRERGRAVAQAAISEALRIERKYSRYLEDSALSLINASAGSEKGVEVDEETAALLDYAATAYAQSDGLFDATSGILRRVWDYKSGRLPASEELAPLLACIGWAEIHWERPTIVLPRAGMELDFGGFGKEYAVDRIAELCRSRGIAHGLVDLGGDLGVVGPHPDGSPWRVGIRHPRRPEDAIATLELRWGGVATSGDYERFMVVEGKRYGHVLDPRSGWPVSGLASASVLAPHCLIAGTASTVALLRGREAGIDWLERLGLPHLWVDEAGRAGGPLAPA